MSLIVDKRSEKVYSSHQEDKDPAVKYFVEALRRSENLTTFNKNGKLLLDHVDCVQRGKREKLDEEIITLRAQRDDAMERIRDLEAKVATLLKGREKPSSTSTLQRKLKISEEALKIKDKENEKLKDEIDDMKLILSLQKHMSQEKNIKSKYQKKLDVLADDIKVQQREISGLTQELESCITERNRAIQERNEALGKLSQYADENDKLKQLNMFLQKQLSSRM